MKRFLGVGLIVVILLAVGGAGLYVYVFAGLPDPAELSKRLHTPGIRITDRNGRLLYEALPDEGGRNRPVALAEIPTALQQATIATEDRTFYENPGVDLTGILRAAWINLSGGRTASGGSTISQQTARNLLMDDAERSQRSLRRKLREAALAWELTRWLGGGRQAKERILELYLNQTYYGGMAYGVEAASQTFFGKPVARLDLAESALIAGLPQAPAVYNPYTDLQAARARQKIVLELMERAGFISAEQRQQAQDEPLRLAEAPYPMRAAHLMMMARRETDAQFTPQDVRRMGGLTVRTTLDLDVQDLAEEAIRRQIEILRKDDNGLGHNLNNAALTAIDPRSGEVLALVGSPDYFDAEHGGAINMAVAPRQPGSALKPLVYAAVLSAQDVGGQAAALAGGWQPWTAATVLQDVRTSFSVRADPTRLTDPTARGEAAMAALNGSTAYIPENYDRKEHGLVSVREALGSSLNIPAVLAMEHVGLSRLFSLTQGLGITTLTDPDRYDLSLALGGGEVRLTELTAAYAALANGGRRVTPQIILDIQDGQGQVVYRPEKPAASQVLDERVAWLISDILSDNDARRLGFGLNTALRLDRPAAVKTGTTSNFHDNWTVGYTPNLAVGVWAGNTSYEPMREVNGLSGAAPIWHQFMRSALSGRPQMAFARPPGLSRVEICALSGLLPTPACDYRRSEWFIDGLQPAQTDNLYRLVTVDRLTGKLAGPQTPPEQRVERIALDLPVRVLAWGRAQGMLVYADLAGNAVGIGAAANSPGGEGAKPLPALALLSPGNDSVYHLTASLPASTQRLKLEASAAAGLNEVVIYMDGQPVETSPGPPYTAFWTLTVGQHTAWAEARAADGGKVSSARVTFSVR
jgi:penicillin-binding protein 1C